MAITPLPLSLFLNAFAAFMQEGLTIFASFSRFDGIPLKFSMRWVFP